MDRKVKIFLAVVAFANLVAVIYFVTMKKSGGENSREVDSAITNIADEKSETEKADTKETSSSGESAENIKLEGTEIKIDTTEDVKGLGYPGQRKLATDGKGNYYIAYRKNYQGYNQIFVARLQIENKRWIIEGTEKPIANVGQKVDQRVPSLTIDQKGVLHVVWYGAESKKETSNRQIKYANSKDGGKTWSQWKNISYVEGYDNKEDYWQEHPYILAGRDNTLYAVWEGKDKKNDKQQIKFSKSTDEGISWSKWKDVNASQERTQSRPVILAESDGTLHLLMYSSVGSQEQQIQHARSTDSGNTWSEWESVSRSIGDARHLSAMIDSADSIHVAWRESADSESQAQIFYASLPKNGIWSNPAIVAQSNNYQFFPNISADRNGLPMIAWMETDSRSDFPRENPETGRIRIARLDQKNSSKFNILDTQENGLYPNTLETLEEDGNFPVVYEKKEAKNFSIVLYFSKGQ